MVAAAALADLHALAVVMPVYNEEECIATVVREWLALLRCVAPDHVILIIDDGSTDGTPRALEAFADEERVQVVRKANAGHGPAILTGYRLACCEAEWVFQTDSDGEVEAASFEAMWGARGTADFIVGVRQGRRQALARRVVSGIARMAVHALYGRGFADVNCPFRLMRARMLEPLLDCMPADTFAPNVALCGLAAHAGLRIAELPVVSRPRLAGTSTLRPWRLAKSAVRALLQTIRIAGGRV